MKNSLKIKPNPICVANRIRLMVTIKPKHVKMFKLLKSNLPMSNKCPVALAIKEQYGCNSVSVGASFVSIQGKLFCTSKNLHNVIINFDVTDKFKYGSYALTRV